MTAPPEGKAPYPQHRVADVVLRDGSTVHIRPLREEDEQPLVDFLLGLSERSRWFRFFSAWGNLAEFAEKAVDADYRRRLDLVATAGTPPKIIAHAVYAGIAPDRAEVAFAVDDGHQGRGLGTILLGHLAEAAQDNGITIFEAVTLPENHRMIEVFRESGFPTRVRSEPGEIRVEFPTSLGPEALERFERREGLAATAAMRTMLAPSSVAVLGASRHPGQIGGAIFHNIIAAGFNGPVYPVNPKAEVVQSVVAYPSVTDIPGPVDVAVVAVPAPAVLDAARACATKGVRGVIVISAGFAETDEQGARRQHDLVAVCREAGMRLIGPNCLGVMNAAPDVRLNATFAPSMPPHGRVGFLTQSGALGLAVIEHARRLGLGLSTFVSNGNKADISGNDLLAYWEQDDDTDVILLYLESFGNPAKFARIARRVGRTKPIVAVKSGRSAAGARATSSHTGALLSASDVTVDALFRQAGVIRCDTLSEMFDVATLLAHQPDPPGDRVVIVTNAGGPGILCADACDAEGLTVAPLQDRLHDTLRRLVPGAASLDNPIDMIASATPDDFRRVITAVSADPSVDAVIAIFIPTFVTPLAPVAEAVRTAAARREREIPLLAVFMSEEPLAAPVRDALPVYGFPEEAAKALARTVRYGVWRRSPEGTIPAFEGIRRDEAAAVLAERLAEGAGWLRPDEVARLLDCYGVPMPDQALVTSPEDAARAAAQLGGRVALKAVAPDLVHRTEAGAVRLGLEGPDETGAAAVDLRDVVSRRGHEVDGFLVQRMAPEGIEMLVGVVHDRHFGPVVALGAGGTAVELLKDVSVRITPLTHLDADEMISSLRTSPLLEGYRGAPPADVAALRDVLLRVSALVEAHPEIAEMDCNPVIVLPEGALVVDARVRVEAAAPRSPLGARRPY